ncbi:hypothetical protein HN859_00255 [Candidatus Parcubacteria bacterium]|jgi:hypothetical protein|nr:hypothetical protein [Candidatus Parcubacteria bacterium]
MPQKKHLFFSARQNAHSTGDGLILWYVKEDEECPGVPELVEVSEVMEVHENEPIPTSTWDDAKYLGIGAFHQKGPGFATTDFSPNDTDDLAADLASDYPFYDVYE